MSRDQPDRNSDTQDWDAMKTLTTWEEGHTIISKDLQPQQSENPPQRPRSAACLFDDCEPREALVIDDGHQRTSSKKQKNKKKKDPHDKCRRHGVAVCQPKFAFAQKMKTKVTAGIKAMCDVYKKDAKDKLLNGFWCVALGGKKTQQSLLEPVELPDRILFFHISLVWGGFQQFSPTVLEMMYLSPDGGPLAWPPPDSVRLASTGRFLNYTEWLSLLDVRMQWSLLVYEVESSAGLVPYFSCADIHVSKLQVPLYVVWNGPSDLVKMKKAGKTGADVLFDGGTTLASRARSTGCTSHWIRMSLVVGVNKTC